MKTSINQISDTLTKITILAEHEEMLLIKERVLSRLAPQVKVAGFRQGKVPKNVAEKNLDPNYLQSEVLQDAISQLYSNTVNENKLRVVAQPKVEVLKYVPFTQLEFIAEVEVVGKLKLPDYKNIKVKKVIEKVTSADVKAVMERLQLQAAEFNEVDRQVATGDRVWIDFEGKDSKNDPVKGASGKDYPLAIGSNTFIPGFEDNIVGLKKDTKKDFTISFPKDYQFKALQGKKVTFSVTVKKIEETKKSEIDDKFAAKMGPFKNIDELKNDIEKQLKAERENQAQRNFEEAIIKDIVSKTKVTIPASLMDEQMQMVDNEFKRTLSQRNQSFAEYLEASGHSEQDYLEKEVKPAAEERLKAGLVLSEIAEAEKINVSSEEIEIRLQIMKNQYKDPNAQAELEKPEAKRDIASRLLTEKTIHRLVGFTSSS